MVGRKIAFISMVFGILLLAGGAGAATNVSSCQVINSPGVYVLNQSIINSTATTCIEITTSDVVFDGAGYTIDGVDASWRYGVYADNSSTSLTNITVGNLTVTDWYYGIYYRDVQNGRIENNNATSNIVYGIKIYFSDYNTLTNNTVTSNGNRGIKIDYSDYTAIANNTASKNSYGIDIYYSNNNTLTNNTVTSNSANGIVLWYSKGNTMTGNVMAANTDYNLYLEGNSIPDFVHTIDTTNTVDGKPIYYLIGVSNVEVNASTNAGFVGAVNSVNVTVRDLTLVKNYPGVLFVNTSYSSVLNVNASGNGYGVYLLSSSYNTFANNTITSNSWNGFYLYTSDHNTMANNTIAGNGGEGIYLTDSANYNTIEGNTFHLNDYGIYSIASSGNTIRGNTIKNTTTCGISLFDFIDGDQFNLNIEDNTIVNSSCGIDLETWSSFDLYNITMRNNTIRDASYGIYLSDQGGSSNIYDISVLGNTISDITLGGIYLYNTGNNTLSGNTVRNSTYGIRIDTTNLRNVMSSNTLTGNGYGYYLSGASNQVISTETISSSTLWDFYSTSSSQNNLITNLMLGYANLSSFINKDVAITAVSSPPPDPPGYVNISKYLNITNTSATSTLVLNVSYTDADLPNSDGESTLMLWRYNGTGWGSVSSYPDTTNNVVVANITGFGIFAPLVLTRIDVPPMTIDPMGANTSNSSGIIYLADQGAPQSFIEETGIEGYEYIVHTKGTTPPVEVNVSVFLEPPAGEVTDISLEKGGIPGFYYKIHVNDSAWFTNVSVVTLKIYYNYTLLTSKLQAAGVGESTLRPMRYTNGSWVRLDCTSLGSCPATLPDGTKLYASGVVTHDVNATHPYIWANLSNFSVYGINGGTVSTPSVGGSSITSHGISIPGITVPEGVSAGSTIKLLVTILSDVYETGATLKIMDLPAGWAAPEIETGPLHPGSNEREISVIIPADAEGEFGLTVELVAKDFIGTARKAVGLVVEKAVEMVFTGTSKPVETAPPAATLEPPATEKPPETPAVTVEQETPAPAVETEGKKGICGPTLVVALALIPVVLQRKRRQALY